MTKFLFPAFILLMATPSFAQSVSRPDEKALRQNADAVPYRLFPTQNMWTFIKLNTRNGQMWQVQFGMKGDDRLVAPLSTASLAPAGREADGRFTLYPTQNMYTFILVDQLDGRTWQVQWSTEPDNRGILPIE